MCTCNILCCILAQVKAYLLCIGVPTTARWTRCMGVTALFYWSSPLSVTGEEIVGEASLSCAGL